MTYAVFVDEIKNNSAHTIIAYYMNEELGVLDYKTREICRRLLCEYGRNKRLTEYRF